MTRTVAFVVTLLLLCSGIILAKRNETVYIAAHNGSLHIPNIEGPDNLSMYVHRAGGDRPCAGSVEFKRAKEAARLSMESNRNGFVCWTCCVMTNHRLLTPYCLTPHGANNGSAKARLCQFQASTLLPR